MRTAARIVPVVLATLLLAGLALPPAGAVPSPTPATTLQFYGGEVRAVAQIGTTIYVGGSFTGVGYGSPTIARAHLVALDATTGLHLPGFDPRADDDVNALLASPGGTRLYLAGSFTTVGGAVRYSFASIAIAARTLTGWNPNIHASGWGGALAPDGATAYLTTADGTESVCGAAHESVIAMPAGTAGTPPVLWHNGGAPGCPFNSGDINAVEATASAVYIGGHLTNLCTVRNTSYTVRCPGALTVRSHVAALDPATGVPLSWNPGATGV